MQNGSHSFLRTRLIAAGAALIITLFLFALLFLYSGLQASQELEISAYTLEAAIDAPLQIVHITDLHNSEFGESNADLAAAIRAQQPDLIFMTGDMLNRDDPDTEVVCSLIRQLREICPVYYGYGNHETAWESNYSASLVRPLTEAGAIVVQDRFVDVDLGGNALRIGGTMNYYRKWGMFPLTREQWEAEEVFADDFENTDRCKILLNHIPTSFVDWGGKDEYNVDFVFSGHYHGGMIRLPWFDRGIYAPYVGLFPEHTKGIVYGTKAVCVQSAGLGTEHAVPRIYNPPEIVVVSLIPANDA